MARFTQFPLMITRWAIIYEIISPGAAGSSIYVLYLLESCRSLEELEIQVTALFSQFKLRERDSYLSRLNPHVPMATRKDLRISPLVGEYLFDEVLVSQAGNRLQGDVSLKSNTIMLDTLAKKSQDHKVRTLPQPKRSAPALTPLVSYKKPKPNPQPTGRGRGKFKGKGHFSGQSGAKGPERPRRRRA